MRDKVFGRVARSTRSELAATFAADVFETLLSAGFAAKKLMRRSWDDGAVLDPESYISTVRPRAVPRCHPELVSGPDDLDASIIVPAYNAESHVKECLDSAIAQATNYRYEILVVDDGSGDGTPAILDGYRDHKDLTVIRMLNAGVATARNHAIAAARGRYLVFLDSDDRLATNSVELLLSAAEREQADIVQGGYDVIDTAGGVIERVRYEACSQPRLDERMTRTSGYPWGKAIRRTLFEKVRFPDGMDFEDTIFALVIFPLCGRYVALSESVYDYRDNPCGITRKLVGRQSALDAYWLVPLLLEQRERLAMPVDANLFNKVQNQFGQLLWARLSGQDSRIKQATFLAACAVVNDLRSRVEMTAETLEYPNLDFIFRERRYDLWSYAGRYGLQ
ncbi:glycosyltransferase family 2 protein [Mycolicibacterium fluoranthenivorans]|uniref:Glycosyltransferase family 2 protein n=1 Tax=Mycolicibacterium fluoranthenivorans TaxID=258505 RepID=A0A7G8PEP5_9MYCO|nr:glycosyltransferase family 2 protein [Mycolicibacterium fluoranthenivorans]QNJ92811.1 glycosyltransferase family 2 protein [Mycolicibacterium fluoranthenivorans]